MTDRVTEAVGPGYRVERVDGTDGVTALRFAGELRFRYSSLVWIVAFLVANVFNFQLNRSWTFRGTRKAPWFAEFWPFLAVGGAAALVGLFVKIAFTNPTSPLYLPEPWFHENAGLRSREYWSQLFTIVITMPINFLANKLWTFRHVRRKHAVKAGEAVGE